MIFLVKPLSYGRFLLYILFVISFTSSALFSQTPVGYKFDLNGQPFNGYYDHIIYHPEEKLSIIHQSDSYEAGYYYDSTFQKAEGLIKFENKKIWFKQQESDIKIKIKPGEVNHLVIGVDSFFTISNFTYNGVLKSKPEFVQFICKIEDITFVKYYYFAHNVTGAYGIEPLITETFFAKSENGKFWENLSVNNQELRKKASQYFKNITHLNEKIKITESNKESIFSLIKTADYLSKSENNEYIHFDQYWQETRYLDKAKYYAQILSINDSVWHLIYFTGKTKLYEVEYGSFFPHVKNGQFKSYYPSGEIRQTIEYFNNKPRIVKSYNEDGLILQEYEYAETQQPNRPDPKINIAYAIVNDSFEVTVNDSTIYYKQLLIDTISNQQYTRLYENNELISSSTTVDNFEVFQVTDMEYDFSINSVQRILNTYMEDVKFEEASNDNAQGILLVSFIIDPKGYVINYSILNKLHPKLNKLIEAFIKSHLSPKAVIRNKFKPYKKGKKKVFCEVVIPFEFEINRFYRKPLNYHYDPMLWNH